MSQTSVDSVNEIDLRETVPRSDASGQVPAADGDRRPNLAWRVFKALRFWVFLAGVVAGVLYTGLGASAVKTGSMRPTIDPGDLVITVNKDIVEPKVGSIIVATPPVAGQDLPAIAHRIIEIKPDGSYKTKGDYNPEPDTWIDRPEDVDKTVIAHIPMGWVRSPLVIAGGLGMLALIFMWPSSKKDEDSEEADAPDTEATEVGDDPTSDDDVLDITDAKQDEPSAAT